MDKDRVAGGVKKVTGKIKEQAGKALGDAGTEAEGKADQAEGRVQGSNVHRGFIDEDLIQREIPDYLDRTFFISGPRNRIASSPTAARYGTRRISA